MKRRPTKSDALRQLRDLDVEIKTVIDVGVSTGTPDLISTFGDVKHLLFEPVSDFVDQIKINYANTDYRLVTAAASDYDGQGVLQVIDSGDTGATTHSSVSAQTGEHAGGSVPVCRLDTFLAANPEPGPYLLKVDVDGPELAVLRGAEGIMPQVKAVVIEAVLPAVAPLTSWLTERGFYLFDIVDLSYYDGVMWQVDLVFLGSDYITNPRCRPLLTTKFEWSRYETLE